MRMGDHGLLLSTRQGAIDMQNEPPSANIENIFNTFFFLLIGFACRYMKGKL